MIRHHILLVAMIAMVVAASTARAADGDDPGAVAPAQPLPHITVDTKRKIVDLDARIVLREGDWIELLGCAPNTREHESIVAILAKPSHVHTALLLVGLKPGSCIRWHWVGETPHVIPPWGSRIAIDIVLSENGKEIEVPANQWIMHKEQKKIVPDNVWLFTGSSLLEVDGQMRYRGDIEGNIISVVNFGDEVLGRPTQVTDKDDKGMLGVNTPKVPKVGTMVKVRLRAAKPLTPSATITIARDGAAKLDDKPVETKALAAALQAALDKGAKDRVVKVEADAKAPPTAYAPILEAINQAKGDLWHVVVDEEAK